jgi:hypothetical protein
MEVVAPARPKPSSVTITELDPLQSGLARDGKGVWS